MRRIQAQLCTWWKRMAGTNWITAGDGSWQDMDRDPIWMDNRRWMTGDGSRETDDNQSPFLLKLRSYNRAQICRHTVFRRHGSTKYDTEHYSEHYSEIPNYAATSPSFNAECDPESDPESISYNADTAHQEPV